MTERDDQNSEEKAAIIARSSILTKLLNDNVELDPERWSSELSDEASETMNYLVGIFGERFANLYIDPQFMRAELSRAFPEEADRESSMSFIEVVVGIGYQLENPDDAMEVLGDILIRLGEVGAIEVYDEEEKRIDVGTDVWAWVLSGTYLRFLETGELPERDIPSPDPKIEDEPEVPDVFKKYVDKNLRKKLDNL